MRLTPLRPPRDGEDLREDFATVGWCWALRAERDVGGLGGTVEGGWYVGTVLLELCVSSGFVGVSVKMS